MDAIEKQARELLARRYAGYPDEQYRIRHGSLTHYETIHTIPAIIAALTPPEGYVLVPVEATEEMVDASMIRVDLAKRYGPGTLKVLGARAWAAMLAARPKVP